MNCNQNNNPEFSDEDHEDFWDAAAANAEEFVNEYQDEISDANDIGKFLKNMPLFKSATKAIDALNKLAKSIGGASSDDLYDAGKFTAVAGGTVAGGKAGAAVGLFVGAALSVGLAAGGIAVGGSLAALGLGVGYIAGAYYGSYRLEKLFEDYGEQMGQEVMPIQAKLSRTSWMCFWLRSRAPSFSDLSGI